jgi:hypothetical protein
MNEPHQQSAPAWVKAAHAIAAAIRATGASNKIVFQAAGDIKGLSAPLNRGGLPGPFRTIVSPLASARRELRTGFPLTQS